MRGFAGLTSRIKRAERATRPRPCVITGFFFVEDRGPGQPDTSAKELEAQGWRRNGKCEELLSVVGFEVWDEPSCESD